MTKVKKTDLGKGLAALLGGIEADVNQKPEKMQEIVRELAHTIAMIPIEQIEINPWQPRKEFDEQALKELSDSIKIHGLIQPITVRRLSANEYQLISGERRLRASKLAELKEVPAYIRLANDQEMLEMALIENLLREELNPIEIANTFARLKQECNLTDEQVSERVSQSRSQVTNMLRLLKSAPQIQDALKNKIISTGHAKVLMGVSDIGFLSSLLHNIAQNHWSVRETEDAVRAYNAERDKKKSAKAPPSVPDAYREAVNNLNAFFGAKIQFKVKPNGGGGSIMLNFKSDQDLNRILDLIEK